MFLRFYYEQALAVVTSFPVFEGADCDLGRNLPNGVT